MSTAASSIPPTPEEPCDLPFARAAGAGRARDDGPGFRPEWRPAAILGGAGWGSAAARRLAAVAVRGRVVGFVLVHGVIFAAAYALAYLIRFDGSVPPAYLAQLAATLPLVVGLKLALFIVRGDHRGWWRYTTFADVTSLAETTAIGTLALLAVGVVWRGEVLAPRSVLILDGAATLLALGGTRGATRLLRERYFPMISSRPVQRVLVVGANEAGMALAHQIQRQPGLGMKVVGYLDESPEVRGRTLAGVRVVGAPDDLGRHAGRHRAQSVLIPTPAVPARVVRRIVSACDEAGLKAQVVPGLGDLIDGAVTVRPRDIEIQDLLARDPVRLDGESIGRLIRGRVVLVTGAAGSIGSEICRQALSFGPERLILLDHSENGLFFLEQELRAAPRGADVVARVASITDPARLRATFAQFRPAVVFHAAAHKHVPMMEANPGEAVKNNVFGTRNVVDESIRSGVETFVLISTDKAVQPTSVMGACKRLAELYCHALAGATATRLISVRFGNVLGSAGSVVPIFLEQIRGGGPVTITHPRMTRYFMTIPEAAQLVLQAGAMGSGGEVFVLDMGEPIRIVDLAREMIRLSGTAAAREVEIVFTGLRPGEKLREELYGKGEEYVPTPHPKVFAVKQPPGLTRHFRADLDRLARVVEGAPEDVIRALAALLPNYRPRLDVEDPAAARAAERSHAVGS